MVYRFLISLALSLFFASPVFSQSAWKRYDILALNGGLNDGFSAEDIKDNEFTVLENLVLTTGGNLDRRGGFDKVNSVEVGTDADCTGLAYYKQSDGDQWLVSVWDDGSIRKMEYAVGGAPDGTWDDITGSLVFAYTTEELASFAIAEDKVIIEDGIDTTKPYVWAGTGNAATLDASAPNAKFVAYHKRKAFAAGDPSNPDILYYSDTGDITNWSTGSSGNEQIGVNGSIIRGMTAGHDALYIWTDTEWYRLSGYGKDSFVLQRVLDDVGCLSPEGVTKIDNQFLFQRDNGDVMIYDGASTVQKISVKIDGTIDDMAFSQLRLVTAVSYDDDLYITYTPVGGSQHSKLLVFDTFNSSWTTFDNFDAYSMCVADDGNGEDAIYFGGYDGFVYVYPSGTDDDGTDISWSATTKRYGFNDFTTEKYLRLVKIYVGEEGNYTLDVEARKDFEMTGESFSLSLQGSSSTYGSGVYGSAIWGGETVLIKRVEPFACGPDFIQLEFSGDSDISLHGFSMFIEGSDRI